MELDEIEKYYASVDDFTLIKLTNEIESLRKDAIPLLNNEIKKRNLTITYESDKEVIENERLKKKITDEIKFSVQKWRIVLLIVTSAFIVTLLINVIVILSSLSLYMNVMYNVLILSFFSILFYQLIPNKTINIVEIKKDFMIVTQHSPYMDGKYSRIILIKNILLNKLIKIEIPIKDILKIRTEKDFFNIAFTLHYKGYQNELKLVKIYLGGLDPEMINEIKNIINFIGNQNKSLDN